MDINNKVIEIVAEVLKVDVADITLDSTIGDFPTWDSLGQLSILQKVQDELDVEFEPEEMMDIEDVKDIIDAVGKKL